MGLRRDRLKTKFSRLKQQRLRCIFCPQFWSSCEDAGCCISHNAVQQHIFFYHSCSQNDHSVQTRLYYRLRWEIWCLKAKQRQPGRRHQDYFANLLPQKRWLFSHAELYSVWWLPLMVPSRKNLTHWVPPWGFNFLCLIKYLMDCDEICHRRPCSPQEEWNKLLTFRWVPSSGQISIFFHDQTPAKLITALCVNRLFACISMRTWL